MKPVILKTLYTIICLGILTDNVLASPDDYTEDLSKHRSIFTAPATDVEPPLHKKHKPKKKKHLTTVYDITPQLEALLLDIRAYHEMTKTIAGYTIQSYNGTNRKKAFQIQAQLQDACYPLKAEVKYKQPNFSVEIGVFLDILEAYPLYFRIKKRFPQAIIRPTAFPNTENLFDVVAESENHTAPLNAEIPSSLHNSKEVETNPQDTSLEHLAETLEDHPESLIDYLLDEIDDYSSVEDLH